MNRRDGRVISNTRVFLALSIAACVLGGVNFVEAKTLFGAMERPSGDVAQTRELQLPDLQIPAAWPRAEDVSSEANSLFARAVPTPAPGAEANISRPTLEPLTLLAVIISSTRRIALLRSQQSGEVQQCEEGANVGGWTLRSIEADGVVLEGPGQRAMLYLPDSNPQPLN